MGNTKDTMKSEIVSTRQKRIAELAQQTPKFRMVSLNKYLDEDWIMEAVRLTRKDGATGIDNETAAMYAENLKENICNLIGRVKSGSYVAPPVRRTHIPKGDGKTRPLGIPTYEDKMLQRSIVMLLEPVYENEFYDFSYGYRPGRSPHMALQELWKKVMHMGGCYLIDADIKGFFDTVEHSKLKEMLNQRVGDGVIRKLVSKWLHAGVWEMGEITYSETGTPQGGVISPLLSNIYLHTVLDEWFEKEIRPTVLGQCFMIRFADDFTIGFANKQEAERIMILLKERMTQFGLELHPEKTKLIDFHPEINGKGGGAFDFLGFTHIWTQSARKKKHYVSRKTSSKRFTRALDNIKKFCRKSITEPVFIMLKGLQRRLQGHFNYYGIYGNYEALARLRYETERILLKHLKRRSGHHSHMWNYEKLENILRVMPLPKPRMHNAYTYAKP